MPNKLIGIFVFLSGCGIEVAQPTPRLFAPNGVTVENVINPATGKTEEKFLIKWYGVNPEEMFSGYNIYYTTNEVDAIAYKGIKILCTNFNKLQPSLVVKPPFNVVRQFSVEVKSAYYANGTFLFTNLRPYWFYVKAYSVVRDIESPPSLYSQGIFVNNGGTP